MMAYESFYVINHMIVIIIPYSMCGGYHSDEPDHTGAVTL